MATIEVVYAGDAYYAKGHHDTGAFWDAMLNEGYIVMDEIWRGYWRWGVGPTEDGPGQMAYAYDAPGRGRFAVTVTEWMVRVHRENDPSSYLGKHNYDPAMGELCRLVALDPELDSPEGRRLMALSVLIGRYEDVHYPIGKD